MEVEMTKDDKRTWVAFWIGIAVIAVGAILIWKWPQLFETIPMKGG